MLNRKHILRKLMMPAGAFLMGLLLFAGPGNCSVQAAGTAKAETAAVAEAPAAAPAAVPAAAAPAAQTAVTAEPVIGTEAPPAQTAGQTAPAVQPIYGPMLVGTDLYYVDPETQDLVRDEFRGTLYFGPDGKYTSGDEVLDTYVEAVLAAFVAEGKTRADLLRDVYVYTRDSFTYLKRNYYEVGETGWEHDEALTMFSTGRGNCYCYASVFYYLSRALGFDSQIVSGLVGSTRQSPHGWVEIVVNGESLIFDTELEMAYLKKNQKYDFFAMSYKNVPWRYVKG